MIFVFCPSNGFSQEQAPEVELCFQTFNSTSSKVTKFVLYEVPNSNSPIRLSGTYANLATVCAHSAIAPRNYSTKDISIQGNSLLKKFGTKEYSTGEHYLKVDCGDLRPGVYFYKLIAGSEKYFSRFVIAR